jgi:hypothetical protein
LGEKLGFERTHSHPSTVLAGVGVVKRSPTVDEVGSAPVVPHPRLPHREDRLLEHSHPVDHRHVEHSTGSCELTFVQSGENPGDEEHRAAAEITNEVERHDR